MNEHSFSNDDIELNEQYQAKRNVDMFGINQYTAYQGPQTKELSA